MFAYSWRRINKFVPNMACVCPETRKRFYEGQTSEKKSVLGSNPDDSDFCGSEMKCDTRAASRPKFFLLFFFFEEIAEATATFPKNVC
jgi:hypothetical protein